MQLLTHADYATDNRLCGTTFVDITNEIHVEFDNIRLKVGEHVQAGVPRAEIDNRGQEPHLLVFPQHSRKPLDVGHTFAFDRFKHDPIKREVVQLCCFERGTNANLRPVNRIGQEVDGKSRVHLQCRRRADRLHSTCLIELVAVLVRYVRKNRLGGFARNAANQRLVSEDCASDNVDDWLICVAETEVQVFAVPSSITVGSIRCGTALGGGCFENWNHALWVVNEFDVSLMSLGAGKSAFTFIFSVPYSCHVSATCGLHI